MKLITATIAVVLWAVTAQAQTQAVETARLFKIVDTVFLTETTVSKNSIVFTDGTVKPTILLVSVGDPANPANRDFTQALLALQNPAAGQTAWDNCVAALPAGTEGLETLCGDKRRDAITMDAGQRLFDALAAVIAKGPLGNIPAEFSARGIYWAKPTAAPSGSADNNEQFWRVAE